MNRSVSRAVLLLGALFVFAAACGGTEGVDSIADASRTDGGADVPDAAAEGDASFSDRAASADAPAGDGSISHYGHVLYLNFNGARIDWNAANDAPADHSTLSEHHRSTTLPPLMEDWLVSPTYPARADVVERVRALAAELYAPFDVQVVTRRPPSSPYTMIVIGGRQKDADWTAINGGVITTFACNAGSVSDLDLGYVFPSYGPLPGAIQTVASLAAHEAGHAFGLVHSANTASVMSPEGTAGAISLAAGAAVMPNNCGRSTQDDAAVLAANVGPHVARPAVPPPPDVTPPVVNVVAPVEASTVSPGFIPCLTGVDPSGIQFVMLQVFRKELVSPLPFSEEVLLVPPFRFAPAAFLGDSALFRFLVVDHWDNLTEVRVHASVQNGAGAAPPCP